MLFRKDYWHPGMDLGDELVGLTGYDCARVQPLLRSGFLPAFPEACENKGRIVLHPDGIGDLSSDHVFPFVESVRWYQAASLLEGLPIRGRRIDGLDSRIDRFVGYFRVFGPKRNESPLQGVQRSLSIEP